MKWLSLSNARRWLISCVIYSYRGAPSLITYTDRVRNEWLLICIHTVSLSETEMDGHVEKKWKHFLPSVIALVSGLDIQNYAGAAY